jgi:ubiquinone/menaquinone biosynthesis C-methylase UbiE
MAFVTNPIGMATQLAGQSARFAWYLALNQAVDAEARRQGARPTYKPTRPVPVASEIFAELGKLLLADAAAVRAGLYPAMTDTGDSPLDHVAKIRAMFADLPAALARRAAEDATSVRAAPGAEAMPEYFAQDFHFQTGGYLTEESARLYDVQVETLFYGTAGPMRRAALRPLGAEVRGRDQRGLSLLDVACGTGRFLRQVRLTYPVMKLTGLDLSRSYLDAARSQFAGLRRADWLAANAESIPLPDASQDIVTSIFLFHELPPEVRRTVAREMARVLRPGGLLVFMDSLQMGDRPGWDGLLEAFPVRFHEPYYRHYTIDDLDALFDAAGLAREHTENVFLSKMMVRRKARA